MVSKARLDLPEPDKPVMTVKVLRGISKFMSLRLCSRAPLTDKKLLMQSHDYTEISRIFLAPKDDESSVVFWDHLQLQGSRACLQKHQPLLESRQTFVF